MAPSDARVRCCTTCGAVYRAQFPRCVNDGTELVLQRRDPLVGTTVGPYTVDALLGEGGMGRVYRVHHARLQQKRYALKVLLGDYAATPPMRMRFAKEAQSASRLSHPNVVAVCDFGVTDVGLAYLAMDLVEGTPLSQLITDRPMAPDRVIRLALQLCAGLAHAHDLGLIHRDFKPDNIIVVDQPSGEVPRIADFGLAISTDESDIRLTTRGMVLGTPAYVAPEQCTDGDVDHRADLYALGVTMFELLTGGRLPFEGEAAEVVGLKATTSPPALAEVAPDVKVPPALAAIVERLIARRPADRYADARAVAAALDEAVRFPDDAALARGDDAAERGEESEAAGKSASRMPRAARADDAALERPHTPPVPFALPERARPRPVTGVRTERVRAAERRRTGAAIVASAIVVAGVAVAAVLWTTRSADDAAASGASPAPGTVVAAAREPAAPPPALADPPRDPDLAAVPPAGSGEPPAAPDRALAATPPRKRPDQGRAPKRPGTTVRGKRPGKPDAPEPRIGALPEVPPPPPAPEVPVPPQPTPPAPQPAPAPVALAPRLTSLDVRGALPNATVQRALDRVLPATRSCRSDRAGGVEVRFAIGESRRASGMRATGLAAGSCLTAALSGLRTDAAPDVGDVEVRVRFTYDRPE